MAQGLGAGGPGAQGLRAQGPRGSGPRGPGAQGPLAQGPAEAHRCLESPQAHLAELVDALDLGSSDSGRGGSSPPVGIANQTQATPPELKFS